MGAPSSEAIIHIASSVYRYNRGDAHKKANDKAEKPSTPASVPHNRQTYAKEIKEVSYRT